MKYLLIIIAALLLIPTIAIAQDVTLSWDASPTPEVTGYKINYQAAPYVSGQWDGTGAVQGASPIDVGDVLTYQLTDLADGVVYYFAVTAYDDDGYCSDNQWANQTDCETDGDTWSTDTLESTYSNIVQSDPSGDSHLHIGGHGMRFWRVEDGVGNRGSVRF